MTKPSFLKILFVGIVAGLLGGAIQSAIAALTDQSSAVQQTTYALLINRMAGSAVLGVAWAAAYRFLPGPFWLQVVIVWALTTSVGWVLLFTRSNVAFAPMLALRSLVGYVGFALAVTFTLHQAIGLALPLVPMARRADEFSDNPSGA